MGICRRCGDEVEDTFRFCPWCAAPLRIKVTELFPGRVLGQESATALRVSRYFGDEHRDAQVRFSVWSDSAGGRLEADAAVSLEESEALRLSRFLAETPAFDEQPTQS